MHRGGNEIPMEKKDFRRLFPHIADEVETGRSKVDIAKAEEPPRSTEPSYKAERKYAGYDPTAVDFIRRCKTSKQAEEIIDFMERRGEVLREEARALRSQLREKGLRSFGPPKKLGYYET